MGLVRGLVFLQCGQGTTCVRSDMGSLLHRQVPGPATETDAL